MKRISKEERKKDLELMGKLTAKSKMTDRDIKELSDKIKKGAAKRFIEYCNKKHKEK